jgi:hypothetical protein
VNGGHNPFKQKESEMNDYLLLFHGGGPGGMDLSPEEMQKIMMKWRSSEGSAAPQ